MEVALSDKEMEKLFVDKFGNDLRPFIKVRAPGRVNLIGEHTDYNDGFVFPMALTRQTTILAKPRTDGVIRIASSLEPQVVEFSIDAPVKKDPPKWSAYPRGVAEALRKKNLLKVGMDALAYTDVPLGGGLSSSASFEVASGLAMLTVNNASLAMPELALACQWAEHHYAGVPCGIMDQYISAMGVKGHAMLLDCRDLKPRQIPLDNTQVEFLIVNSNVKHELVQGEYTARRNQCHRAVEVISRAFPMVKALRDVSMPMLEECRLNLDPVVFRRARHVITENQRTLDFAAALEAKNWKSAGKLMYASHESLRDDYGVSCPELDALVEICSGVSGIYGARMTGGGFGGSIVVMGRHAAMADAAATIDDQYPRRTGLQATHFVTTAGPGAHVVSGLAR